ncbi:MAG: oxaloacetate decarboxylase, partial [Betaproteobacteria bacterium]
MMIKQGFNTLSNAERRALLRSRIRRGKLTIAPGVFEMISAKIADSMGFEALYMTGYGTVASYMGLPDAGIATYTDMVNRVAQFATITSTPMICDGDTGYGGLLNVMHTVRGYEAAGACAIQLEDQQFPKKCGHMLGRKVVSADEMAAKIRVAVETRNDPNFLIIARTDARTTLGLDEAMRRAEVYARAGADMLFIEAPQDSAQLALVGKVGEGRIPLMANMVEGGRTPVLSASALEALGFSLVIFPGGIVRALARAAQDFYGTLARDGQSNAFRDRMFDFEGLNGLLGTAGILA